MVAAPDTPDTELQERAQEVQSCIVPWLAALAYWLARRILFPCFFRRIEVQGQELLPKSGPVLLAPTHRARWDALIVPYATGRLATGRDVHFMVTADEVSGLQGWLIRRLGGFAVNQRRPSISSLRYPIALLRAQQQLVIFPEGNIFREGHVNSLRPGLARLAVQAMAQIDQAIPIVPIAIAYSHATPRWRDVVRVQIGTPLSTATYAELCRKQASEQLTTDLQSALEQLNDQVRSAIAAQPPIAGDAPRPAVE
jgi:1-acyl-sn-glycerol-3-phosphate acyltransferase